MADTDVDNTTGLKKGSFGIGTFQNGGDKPFPGMVLPDGTTYDLSDDYSDTHAIFDDWDRALDGFCSLAETGGKKESRYDSLVALPPLAHPNILGAGANYRQHVAEMMTHNAYNQHNRLPDEDDESFFKRNYAEVDRRSREGMPFFWTGLHSSLTGANSDVIAPVVAGESLDWELEFTAVASGTGRLKKPDETNDLVAGYMMVNDLGTVGEFRRTDVRWGYDWVSKHQPSFKVAGPFIVPKQFVDTDNVQIKLHVNDVVKQDWPISDMIFSVEQFLSYASERIRLMPGDILLTGSPPGNGAMHGHFLVPGDIMESEITGLGRQRNHIVAEDAGGREPTYGKFPST